MAFYHWQQSIPIVRIVIFFIFILLVWKSWKVVRQVQTQSLPPVADWRDSCSSDTRLQRSKYLEITKKRNRQMQQEFPPWNENMIPVIPDGRMFIFQSICDSIRLEIQKKKRELDVSRNGNNENELWAPVVARPLFFEFWDGLQNRVTTIRENNPSKKSVKKIRENCFDRLFWRFQSRKMTFSFKFQKQF